MPDLSGLCALGPLPRGGGPCCDRGSRHSSVLCGQVGLHVHQVADIGTPRKVLWYTPAPAKLMIIGKKPKA